MNMRARVIILKCDRNTGTFLWPLLKGFISLAWLSPDSVQNTTSCHERVIVVLRYPSPSLGPISEPQNEIKLREGNLWSRVFPQSFQTVSLAHDPNINTHSLSHTCTCYISPLNITLTHSCLSLLPRVAKARSHKPPHPLKTVTVAANNSTCAHQSENPFSTGFTQSHASSFMVQTKLKTFVASFRNSLVNLKISEQH